MDKTYNGNPVTRIRVFHEGDGWVVDGATDENNGTKDFTHDVYRKWYDSEVEDGQGRAVADAKKIAGGLPVFMENEAGEWMEVQ